MRTKAPILAALCLVCGLGLTAPALAQDYDFDWSTIGHPGNRPTNAEETAHNPFAPPMGAVGYEYRLAKTEVTAKQWLEFVRAYAPYWSGSRYDSAFIGYWIYPANGDPDLPPDYRVDKAAENFPTEMSWRMAARYCNWLQNGKRPERDAFENGAYDTSTFTTNSDGTFNDQRTHTAGASFWIPTVDEWIKAAYYDPNRYGDGVEGYWLYNNQSNAAPIYNAPWNGGESNGGTWEGDDLRYFDVASYPHTKSTWALYDLSGGVMEYTEGMLRAEARGAYGSDRYQQFPEYSDLIADYHLNASPDVAFAGFRIASVVPSSGCALWLGSSWSLLLRRRRHHV
ncbi:MAG: SUMF1/EgtB/PvdO family nonheme iron enzyme [Phycisphaerales bacterium]|nr:SUMF1/EgtB/PvdO family nonheme iron enzyme [Phycisphaerales bacterium]